MFVAPDFIYLMCPKTGCMDTMKRLKLIIPEGYLERVAPEGKHNGIWCVEKAKYRSKTILGSIRNPFAWYLSHWAHFCYKNEKGKYWKQTVKYDPKLEPLLTDSTNVNNFKHWLERILVVRQHDPDYNKKGYSDYVGWLTHYFARMYLVDYPCISTYEELCKTKPLVDYWIHCESITTDIQRYFKKRFKNKQRQIEATPPQNTTEHPTMKEAYTEDLKALVIERDFLIFNKFGYSKS